MSSRKATAVIVTYCSEQTIGAVLKSIEPSREAGLLDVVVVDNNSSDGTVHRIRSRYPWVNLIESDDNLGFGRGCNLGFEQVRSPYTLFLNPDATISKEALETLLDFMDSNPQAGMCAPAIREPDGTMQAAGLLPTPIGLLQEAFGLGGYEAFRKIQYGDKPFRTSWLCGAVLLVRSDVFRTVHGFDPRFFLYFEETDLCRRIADDGYELWAVGEALANHTCGVSTNQLSTLMSNQCVAEYYYKSRFYYLVKHHGWATAAFTELGAIGLLGGRVLVNRVRGRLDKGRFVQRLGAPILRLPERVERQ